MIIDKKWSINKKKGRGGMVPILIVNHITEGAYMGAISWLSNPQSYVSAHFVTSRDGQVTQMVPIEDTAWTQATSIKENSNISYKNSTIEAINKQPINANAISVGIEHEGFYNKTKGRLTDVQYKRTLELHKYIIDYIKEVYNYEIPINRDHIVGHFEIAPRTKPNCPGEEFPFDKLINDLKKWRKGEEKKEEKEEEKEKGKEEGKDEVKVEYKGNKLILKGYNIEGYNWINLRDFIEKTGNKIEWNEEEKVAVININANIKKNTSLSNKTINGLSGIIKVKLIVNGEILFIDGYIKEGQTFIRLRDFINNTDLSIEWENVSKTIIIK